MYITAVLVKIEWNTDRTFVCKTGLFLENHNKSDNSLLSI